MEEVKLDGDIETPEHTASAKRGIMSLSFSNIQWKDWIQKRRDGVQPWSDFLNTSKFKLPKAVLPVGTRIVKNTEKFQSNYLFVFLILVAFCVLTSPLLLVAIAACLGACYIISIKNQDKKLSVMGKELSLAQQYAGVGVLSFPLFWLAGAGSAVFWVIGASFFVIMAHASLYRIEEEAESFDLQMETV